MRRVRRFPTTRKKQAPTWRALGTMLFATVIVSAVAGVTTAAGAAGTPPAVPTGVKATVSGTSVTVTWTNGAGALGASVFRDTTTKLSAGGWPNPTPTSFTDTGVSVGTHTYAVADYNSSGFGPTSGAVSVTVGGVSAPTVSAVSPNAGAAAGGTRVTISGTSFTGATAVAFGATPATNFTVNSATTITATSAAGTGTVDVTVATPGGRSAVNAGDRYTYTAAPPPPPSVTLVNPVTGPPGTPVTVSGTNLTGATAVAFGATPATSFTVNNATTITATAPAGSGTVDVRVTTPGGTSATSANDQFTYSAGTSPVVIPSPTAGGWQLNGSATLVSSASPPNLQLTAATANQAGSAFWPKAVSGVGISAAFDASIGSGTGADGLTFTLADASAASPTALGSAGGGEGFAGVKGIAVSLDTYQNSVNPSGNFVGIATGQGPTAGTLQYVTTNSSIASLRSTVHHFVVTTFSTGLTVTMDGSQVLTYATSLPASVLVGFTGGTGGLTDIHAVKNVSITSGTPPPAPTVTGIAPASGPSGGGTSVTLTGTNLTGASEVDFGAMPASAFTVNSATSITVTTPPGSGTVDATVVTAGGTSATSANDQFTFTGGTPVPTVSGLTPNSGAAAGGTPVTVSGTNLTGATAVAFGATPATSFTVNNATTITATAPAGSGTVDVRVTTPGGTSATSANDQFTYSAGTSPVVIPSPTAGGWQLNGSATLVSSASPPNLQLTAATANQAGSAFWPKAVSGVGISAAFDASIGSGTGADGLTFTLADASAASPTALGSAGGGEGFAGVKGIAVSLDTYQNSVNPSGNFVGIATGQGPTAGTLQYVTTNSSIASLRSTVHHFVVTTFSTGLTVTMDGSQVLTYATSLPASVLVGFTGGTGGLTDIHAVKNVSITSGTPPPAPTVTGIAPASGPSGGGTSVTLTGTNLTGASEVDFGAMPASAFTVNSATSITVTTPPGSGTVDATVVTAGGTSATSANDQFTFTGGTPPPSGATYRGDLGRSGYYPAETGLTTANAASLKVHWTAGGGVDSFAQPIVANNMVFWSDWSGSEHGANLNGQDVWKTNIGTTTPPASDNCSPATSGPTSTPTLGTVGGVSALFVGGGNGVMYALNAQTGKILWQTRLGTSPDNFLWDSPALYNGTIYMGVASYGDCPLVQGQLVALNAATGAITGTADMVPNGCIGGGIWSSPTVDTSAGTIWVTTGTPHACSNGTAYAPALVELRASDLSVLGYWNVPVSSQSAGDPDFGSTPTLFTATINGQVRSLVGAVNKDAIFYAWDRTNPTAGPVWQSTIATASGDPAVGSIVSASWDGSNLYVGGGTATINGTTCSGSLDALNPSTGAFVWRSCQTAPMYGGITEVPGVIVEGTLGGTVLFLNAATGATLLNYKTGVSEVQGECAVSSGIVYIPLDDGALVALGQ